MKRLARWVPAAVLFPILLALPAPRLAGALDPGRYFVLENGLRVFLYEKRDLPLVHVVTGFDLGSKNETGETNGFVHLLEHAILFRGSGDPAGLRRHGAYFNGSTGQDLAVFEISLPSAHAGFALRCQRDILFGFGLDAGELEAEKEVVLEELGEMEDDPDRAAADRVLRELFAGHPYGRSVYGDRGVIAAATSEGLLAFHRRFFTADNAAMAVVGDFERVAMERLVREAFGDLPRTGSAAAALPMAAPLGKDSVVRLERDVKEGTLYLAFPAPDYNHPDRYAMRVLAEALGRGVNPLLSARLRSERDSVQRVTMSYLEFRYGGAAVVAVKAVPSDLAAVERTALAVLKRAGSENYSRKDYLDPLAEMTAFDFLESAKNQIRFSSGQAEESGLQLAASFVRHMLLNTRERPGRYLDEIARIGSGDLRRTAARYFGRADHVMVTVAPRRGGRK